MCGGGRAGLGFAITQHLVRKGAKIYIAARPIDRAEDAIRRLEAAGTGPGHGQLESLELDLVDPHVVKRAAEEFMRRESRLDVLSECWFCSRWAVFLTELQSTVLRCKSSSRFRTRARVKQMNSMMIPYQKTNYGTQEWTCIRCDALISAYRHPRHRDGQVSQ